MSVFAAQLHPGRALGFLVLGASLHDILTRLKAEPQRFPKLDLVYSQTNPVDGPIILTLPANGLRLRFDGPKQQLRLIEVIDFTRNQIFFKPTNDKELYLVRPPNTAAQGNQFPTQASESVVGPTFRHIYQRFLGPTYNGEYISDANDLQNTPGTYVLSYPGVAFTFPMPQSDYSPDKDVVSLLSSSTSQVATSMAIFSGDSWAEARETLWSEELPSIRSFPPLAKGKDVCPEEVSYVVIHGGGELELRRPRPDDTFWIHLGQTTPQEIVARLGPPDAIYRKNDQRMYIHKIRAASNTMSRPNGNDLRRPDDLTDTDQSSAHATSDDYDSHDEAVEEDLVTNVSGECFYNYFYLGFDILVSTPAPPSRLPPSQVNAGVQSRPSLKADSADKLVATKMILHGNIPGSYPFNRHRRCRWVLNYLDFDGTSHQANQPDLPGVGSETPFHRIEASLRDEWKSIYASEEEARQQQRGMVLNRGWGDSPGSSCELLGGWEESGGINGLGVGGKEDSTTTLYGFPGLVFEVLKNGYVSAVTVY